MYPKTSDISRSLGRAVMTQALIRVSIVEPAHRPALLAEALTAILSGSNLQSAVEGAFECLLNSALAPVLSREGVIK